MINIGDKTFYFKNPEDIMSLTQLEVLDVYEVSLEETHAEIKESWFVENIEFGEKIDGVFGEGRSPIHL